MCAAVGAAANQIYLTSIKDVKRACGIEAIDRVLNKSTQQMQ